MNGTLGSDEQMNNDVSLRERVRETIRKDDMDLFYPVGTSIREDIGKGIRDLSIVAAAYALGSKRSEVPYSGEARKYEWQTANISPRARDHFDESALRREIQVVDQINMDVHANNHNLNYLLGADALIFVLSAYMIISGKHKRLDSISREAKQ